MAAKSHAILSASSSDRWLHCPPSARLCETYEDKGSDYAAEGTDAHALGEHKLKTALGLPSEDPTDSLKWYSEEMEDCTSGYAEYVLEQIEAAKETCADPVVLIEQRVDFSRWVEQGFGTADCIIIADGTLRVIDYKHGLGVLVSAEANPQMQCYALGALELFDDIYDIDQVSMTIQQKMILWRKTTMSKNVKISNPMKVITGVDTRWSYANVWEPKSINGGTPKYSVSLIIPKSDTKTIAKIQAAIEAAYKEGEAKLKGNGKSVPALSVLKTPLRDGDAERPDDEAYKNAYFVNANATSAPGIVDADLNPILTRSEVYSGVYGRASITFYAFNSSGNKGIACGLNNLQKIRDGEPLGGKASAESDFATDDDEDFLN